VLTIIKKQFKALLVIGVICLIIFPIYIRISYLLENNSDGNYNENNAPIISNYYPSFDPKINETETQDFNITAYDPDGDVLAYSWCLNGTVKEINTTSYSFDAKTEKNGTYIVNVNISDGVHVVNHTWTMIVINNSVVIIENENRSPIISSYYPLSDPRINQTDTQDFNITAYDPDGDLLAYAWYVNSTIEGINITNYVFNATNQPNGTHIVKVNVTDGSYVVEHTWTVIVNNKSVFIIDHTNSRLNDLKSIPLYWINKAKSELNIAYGHTSHGSQLTSGMTNLDAFMGGNSIYIFGSDGGGDDSKLEFYDYSGDFGGSLTTTYTASDLGNPNDNEWADATEEYLDHPSNPGTNVIMWSWCYIGGHDIPNYLSRMEDLISKYSAGGSKGRTEDTEVKFVFMTGHVDGDGIGGTCNLQNELIRDHCKNNNRYLFDFADIESYDPDNNYYLDLNVDDDCSYDGGNWATEWIVGKTQMTSTSDTANNEPNGGDWYSCSSAHSHALNANLKAYGCWYLFSILAGWNGN